MRGDKPQRFEEVRPGHYVKARVGNESLWFVVIGLIENNAVRCRMASDSITGIVFEGECTLDRNWISEFGPPQIIAEQTLTVIQGGKP